MNKSANRTSVKWIILITLLLAPLCLSAGEHVIPLDGQWKLTFWKQPARPVRTPEGMQKVSAESIAATVPGNVELDLLRAGRIEDPEKGSNVYLLRPWEGYQWCYSREFTAPALQEGQTLELRFGGIDCLADVFVNGRLVGSPENMLIPHSFDITDCVHEGAGNSVQVILRSVVLESQRYVNGEFSIGMFASEEANFIRKAPSMYGWDIMPRLVSAGLWRSVELRVEDAVHYRDVNYFTVSVDTAARRARLQVQTQLSAPMDMLDKMRQRITLSRGGRVAATAECVVNTQALKQDIWIDKADLWWPCGYGEPALYKARAELIDTDGNVLAADNRRIGLRTVRLDRTDTSTRENRGRFCFYVNGEPIFIHGTNWVPLDALHSRDTMHVDRMMEMAADLNVNMIRCWGGNVYEDDHFFDRCDELGILVWQDFAMGCNFYPQDDDFARRIAEEVKSVVLRLRSHPSLALWAGNNEDDQCSMWGVTLPFDPTRDRISREVIPRVLYEFDLSRPYLPSSPYVSPEVYAHRDNASAYQPEDHLWGPRGYYKDPFYTQASCLFCSEIGYHGCPNLESLKRMFSKDCVYPWTKDFQWNEEWLTKSVRRYPTMGQTNDRNNLMINQVRLLFGDVPKKLEDFIFASQSVQAEAMKYFLEMWRGQKFDPRTGIIWWNLRDGWPLISDAVVDYYYSRKRAYYYIRNAERDVCVFINDGEGDTMPLMAVNDTRLPAGGSVTVTDVESGKQVFAGSFSVERNGKTCVARLPRPAGQGVLMIRYKVDGKEYGNHYLYGRAPFRLSDYRKWMQKTGLYNMTSTPLSAM